MMRYLDRLILLLDFHVDVLDVQWIICGSKGSAFGAGYVAAARLDPVFQNSPQIDRCCLNTTIKLHNMQG